LISAIGNDGGINYEHLKEMNRKVKEVNQVAGDRRSAKPKPHNQCFGEDENHPTKMGN
jgi:hypothetical protein